MASRGKGRRRREALALRSSRDLLKRGKSGMAKQLPPPPQAKDGEQLVPRSLKRMMALRQGQAGASPAAGSGGVPGKKRGNKFKMVTAAEGSHGSGAATTPQEPQARADASGAQQSGEQPAPGSAQPGARFGVASAATGGEGQRADGRHTAGGGGAASTGSVPDHLSERQRARREHSQAKQAKKKARRKGGGPGVDGSDDEDALERRLLANRNKPKFGEQAMAPLQTSLKRKHWDAGANARHSTLFAQQMRQATARATQPDAAVRDQVIEAYRQQKRSAGGKRGSGVPITATRASLAALTSKHGAAVNGLDSANPNATGRAAGHTKGSTLGTGG